MNVRLPKVSLAVFGLAILVSRCEAEIPASDSSVYQLSGQWESVFDGRKDLTLRSFEGKPVALALVYASCPAVCPTIVETLKRAGTLADAESFRVVLVTLDPEVDSRETLERFAEKHHLPRRNWFILRGSPENVRELSVALGAKYSPTGDGQFVHSNSIVILNERGEAVGSVPGALGSVNELVRILSSAGAPSRATSEGDRLGVAGH